MQRLQPELCEIPPQSPDDSPSSSSSHDHTRRLRVGCALLPKKVQRYLTPAMKAIALTQGMELCLIDYGKPLRDQGPFDAIIHKLRPNQDWERNLLDYCQLHPSVAIIDSVDGIRTLQNRSTMLTALNGEGVLIQKDDDSCMTARVQAPHQVEIVEGTSAAEAKQMLADAGLHPPLLIKPLWTDGREGSHGLAVLHDLSALDKILNGDVSSDLQPPLVVQQFVEHGGVLFKIYVLGDRTVVSKRPSLGDKYLGIEARKQGVLQLPRISCKSVYAPGGVLAKDNNHLFLNGSPQTPSQPPASVLTSPGIATHTISPDSPTANQQQTTLPNHTCSIRTSPTAPPDWVSHTLASILRQRLGLQLFNFDLICPEDQGTDQECIYYVIDINYFPGVDKIPNFEHVFIDFLKSAVLGAWAGQNQDGTEEPVA